MCVDCHVKLSLGQPPSLAKMADWPAEIGKPELEFMTVYAREFTTSTAREDRLRFALAKGLLEDSGIPFYASGDQISPGRIHGYFIVVGQDREREARELLQVLERAEPAAE